jgi:hypothetical protein
VPDTVSPQIPPRLNSVGWFTEIVSRGPLGADGQKRSCADEHRPEAPVGGRV